MTNKKLIRSDILLFITALIWGSAFAAQILGMKYTGPFMFNAIRFAIGAVFLLPFLRILHFPQETASSLRSALPASITAGFVLFAGAALQQIGLTETTAGNAGFITGLYVLIVPIISFIFGFKPERNQILGILLAFAGLYLLSIPKNTSFSQINRGDVFVFIGAFFWALHVVVIGKFSPQINPVLLSIIQFMTCSILSFSASFLYEQNTLDGIILAGYPILYSGLLSVGIAYTLQVIAQRNASPTHSVLILTLESVFAAIAGWIILGESFTGRQMTGAMLMLAGMLISQLRVLKLKKS